jgi:acetyl-CoA carboxylase biotin carboxylase subunit
MTIRRLLIANRGEIAVRILRACRETGIESVAVYSDADEGARHVREADRAVRIGPAPPAESYLAIPAIIEAARQAGADAIHPGYGFLSEQPALAAACEQQGIIFVGPPSAVIRRMGSKIEARSIMQAAGVPIVPGSRPDDQSDRGVMEAARAAGYPVLVKASAGGGGKGMRLVQSDEEANELVPAARREALTAFGDGTLYVERVIERPRHVEIQIFADSQGAVVHLFERECSLQRRHQKILEESPSPALTIGLRERMGQAAVSAARASGYRNAGTVEFLVEGEGEDATFHFLEMNTRLQVEHGVTEAVTGVDLVRAQLAVAAGGPLPWSQASLSARGHAIECRIYAEDPDSGFVPQAGPLLLYREPSGPGLRVDSGVQEGDTIGVHYDPLLAKIIAYAETRDAAVCRLRAALRAYPVLGIRTNIPFLLKLIALPGFAEGRLDTEFVERHLSALTGCVPPGPAVFAAAAAAAVESSTGRPEGPLVSTDPWSEPTRWGR